MSQHNSLSVQKKNFGIDTYPELYAISSTTYERAAATELDRRRILSGVFSFSLSPFSFSPSRAQKNCCRVGPQLFWVAAAAAHHVRRMGMGKGKGSIENREEKRGTMMMGRHDLPQMPKMKSCSFHKNIEF